MCYLFITLLVYKTLARECDFNQYFVDTRDESFQASAAISHVRFATNTLPQMKNIQPLPGLVNNGENNNIGQIERLLTEDPGLRNIVKTECDMTSLSDSHVQSMFVDYAFLEHFKESEPTIDAVMNVALTVNPSYVPKGKPQREVSEYFDVMGDPWEGPFGGILCFGNVLTIMRDRNGFRPLRGVEDDTYLYVGSELGPVELTGRTFHIIPAQPMVVDISTGEYRLKSTPHKELNHDNPNIKFDTMSSLRASTDNTPSFEYPQWSEDEFSLMKRRAGWNNEVDQMIIQRLLRGEELTSSMADQGPVEALVPGSNVDLGAFFKAKFAQVTNPALAKREEACFMSSDTWIGTRAEFGHWEDAKQVTNKGVLSTTPIIDGEELALLQQTSHINAQHVSILYPVNEYDQGLQTAITRIIEDCKDAIVKNNANMIILSDLVTPDQDKISVNSEWISVYPVLIAAEVDRSLRKAGIRRKASVVMQAASILIGRDVAQLISIGGVDVIHPYLVLMSVQDDKKATANYKERLRQELLGFMARMGISRVSAYRGAKIFSAYGLNADLATRFGVESRLGGISFSDLAKLQYNNYHCPSIEGLGRYKATEDATEVVRDKTWKPEVTQRLIRASRRKNDSEMTEDFAEFELWADQTKIGVPRGWLDIVKPTRWSQTAPLPVAIIGGGAAGFYLAQHLLESDIPLYITIIDRNYVNRCGLVGYGVAPDHPATKKQGYALLNSIIYDDHVEYFGGIEVGRTISVQDLRRTYACIVDCRGATKDTELNIPGQEHSSVIAASRVYEAYNSALIYDYHAQDWPFSDKSRHPAIAIIGMGNVASDIARILLSPTDKFEDTNINPEFLVHLRRKAPSIVYLIARGGPTNCKITKKELNELKELQDLGVSIHVSFDESTIKHDQLDENQKYLLDFFTTLGNQDKKLNSGKQLHFMFQHTPEYIQDVNDDVEIYFEGIKNGIRARNIVTALGRAPQPSSDQIDYVAGWAARRGGNLRVAEQSAKQIAMKIQSDYFKHKFHAVPEDFKLATWKFTSPVNKYEFMSIFEYTEKHVVRTASDFHLAKSSSTTGPQQNEDAIGQVLFPENVVSNPESITVFDGQQKWDLIPGEGTTLLQDLKRVAQQDPSYLNIVPSYECDGEGTCGTCGLLSQNAETLQTSKEKRLLSIDGGVMKKCGVLTCQHSSEALKGQIFFLPQAVKIEKNL
jgi:ferredoxin